MFAEKRETIVLLLSVVIFLLNIASVFVEVPKAVASYYSVTSFVVNAGGGGGSGGGGTECPWVNNNYVCNHSVTCSREISHYESATRTIDLTDYWPTDNNGNRYSCAYLDSHCATVVNSVVAHDGDVRNSLENTLYLGHTPQQVTLCRVDIEECDETPGQQILTASAVYTLYWCFDTTGTGIGSCAETTATFPAAFYASLAGGNCSYYEGTADGRNAVKGVLNPPARNMLEDCVPNFCSSLGIQVKDFTSSSCQNNDPTNPDSALLYITSVTVTFYRDTTEPDTGWEDCILVGVHGDTSNWGGGGSDTTNWTSDTLYSPMDAREVIGRQQSAEGRTPSQWVQDMQSNVPRGWNMGLLDSLWQRFLNSFQSHFYASGQGGELVYDAHQVAASGAVGFGMYIPKVKHYRIAEFSPKLSVKFGCGGLDVFAELRAYFDFDKLIDYLVDAAVTRLWAIVYGVIASSPAVMKAIDIAQNIPSFTFERDIDMCQLVEQITEASNKANSANLPYQQRLCINVGIATGRFSSYAEAYQQCVQGESMLDTSYVTNNMSQTALECWKNRLRMLSDSFPQLAVFLQKLTGEIKLDITENNGVREVATKGTPIGDIEDVYLTLRDTIIGRKMLQAVDAMHYNDLSTAKAKLNELLANPVLQGLAMNVIYLKALSGVQDPVLRANYTTRFTSYIAWNSTEYLVDMAIKALRQCATAADNLSNGAVIEDMLRRAELLEKQRQRLREKIYSEGNFVTFLSVLTDYYKGMLKRGAEMASMGTFESGGGE